MVSDEHISRDQITQIEEIAPERNLLITENENDIIPRLDEFEIATGWVPRDILPKLQNLRWFQQWGAGVDWLLKHPESLNRETILTNASGLHAIPISEHIFSLILAFTRDLPKAFNAKEQRNWLGHEPFKVVELSGKTLVLLGLGAIGGQTAKIANSFGMKVFGIRRNPEISHESIEKMYGPSELNLVLPKADFFVLTVPLTTETKGMIGESEFKMLPKTSFIVNIGRGGTIQERYLIQALEKGWIAGAGLDVFENEPLPQDSPLWEMENVIITPHYAGKTPYYAKRALGIFIENLKRFQVGVPLNNLVGRSLGY